MAWRFQFGLVLAVTIAGCSGQTDGPATGGSPGSGGEATGGTSTGGTSTGGTGGGTGTGGACTQGDTKPADDGCNTCSCTEGGQWACTLIGCLNCPPPRETNEVCPAVAVYAKQPQTGTCCEYGDPCQAPENWETFNTEEECVSATDSSECVDDDDCDEGYVCEPGTGCDAPYTCIAGCHDSNDCAVSETCEFPNCFTCPCPGTCL